MAVDECGLAHTHTPHNSHWRTTCETRDKQGAGQGSGLLSPSFCPTDRPVFHAVQVSIAKLSLLGLRWSLIPMPEVRTDIQGHYEARPPFRHSLFTPFPICSSPPPSLVSPHVLQFFIGQWASLIFKTLCSALQLCRRPSCTPYRWPLLLPNPWFRCPFLIQLLAVPLCCYMGTNPKSVSFLSVWPGIRARPLPLLLLPPRRKDQGTRSRPTVPAALTRPATETGQASLVCTPAALPPSTLYLVCASAPSLPGLRFPWAGVRILEDACNLPATDSRTDSGHLQHTAALGDAPWDAVEKRSMGTARHTIVCSAGSQQCSGPCSSPPQWNPLCRFWGPSSKDREDGGLDSRWWEGDLGGTPADLHNLAAYDALIMRSQAPIPGLTWAVLFVSEVKTGRTAFRLGFPATGTERAGRT